MATSQHTFWDVGQGERLKLGADGVIMAIVNVTPDSFSDGGRHNSVEQAVAYGLKCVDEGAHILDIGGESTRPGAEPISAEEEQARILPVIEALKGQTSALISVDTYRASTASAALQAGAHIINDVHGLHREPEIADVVAKASAGLCIMHTGRDRQTRPDLIEDQGYFFNQSLNIAFQAGVAKQSIVLDPGFGFAKDTDADLSLMARFSELHQFGYPLLVGTSRKRTMGALTGRTVAIDRDHATAATTAVLRMAGAQIFRVHNVTATRDTLSVVDAILNTKAETATLES